MSNSHFLSHAISILRYALLHISAADLPALKQLEVFPNRVGRLCKINTLLDPTVTEFEQLLSVEQAGMHTDFLLVLLFSSNFSCR